ncbi:MAG: metallophosphoesterase family protein [Coriobacteriia bacterium]|nr:metallophosphoesterase family protein [Coriobacteriia bacterium]
MLHLESPAHIGAISDTHGELDPRALEALAETDLIVHAGDIGGQHILLALEAVAPVVAVRGNTDHAPWAFDLPDTALFTVGPLRALVVHSVGGLRVPKGVGLVISGHTHRPLVESRGGVLCVNPGSATEPRTQGRARSVALISVGAGVAQARVVTL